MRPPRPVVPLLAALAFAAASPLLVAQEEPVTAGSEGVPAPKRTKHVQPNYPPEALAQGIRGIVILELVVDAQGKVESTSVLRSVPGLDGAAVAAARQWEYAPTKVDGKPVRVRVTVPVVFSLALPTLTRQTGIPELRQGVAPAWPSGASGGGLARAELTLEPDGRVGGARILEGGPPWSEALLAAVKTWRFAPPPEDEVLSFRVEAEFVSGGGANRKVNLEATGLQRSGLLEEPPPQSPAAAPPTAAATAAPPAPAAVSPETSPPQAPVQTAPAQVPAEQAPPAPPVQTPPAQVPTPPAPPAQVPAPPAAPAQGAPAPAEPGPAPVTPGAPAPPAARVAPPPVEVITAPPPVPPPENGVSAIRDVTLQPGVPDLTRGRRPVAPPFARMAGSTGSVEVAFSVGAAGTTTVQSATGPDLLKPAAEQAVASWVFRRTRADRAYLVAVFTYTGDKSSAVVRPQQLAPSGDAAEPAPPAAPPAGTAPTRP
ncbi:MAG TPA: TonB family protein [Vicinamibacteria bacterium]|nr:TonB family protein [Vicinamibacteria bacterium]